MSSHTTLHLRITGRVQGVGYRMAMLAMAEQLGVKGWVRNLRDGSVEAMVQGEEAAVDDLLAWARMGPPGAQVSGVEASPAAGDFIGFSVRPDA